VHNIHIEFLYASIFSMKTLQCYGHGYIEITIKDSILSLIEIEIDTKTRFNIGELFSK